MNERRRDIHELLKSRLTQGRSFGSYVNMVVVAVGLVLLLLIWKPWMSPEERIALIAPEPKPASDSDTSGGKAAPADEGPFSFSRTGWVAGTTWRVVAEATTKEETERLVEAVAVPMHAAGKLFDREDALSTLNRLEGANPGSWVTVEPLFARVLRQYLDLARITRGACDPTTGSLIMLHRFGDKEQDDTYPKDEERAAARSVVSHTLVEVRSTGDMPEARLLRPWVKLDWITLGRAAMLVRAKEIIAEQGLDHILVFAGYDAYAAGQPLGEGSWEWQTPDSASPTFKRNGVLKRPSGKTVGAALVSEKGRTRQEWNYWIHPYIDPRSLLPGRAARQAVVVGDDPAYCVIAARCALLAGPDKAGVLFAPGKLAAFVVDAAGVRHTYGPLDEIFTDDGQPTEYQ